MTSERRREQWRRNTQRRFSFNKNLLSTFPCKLCGESDSDLIDWHHVVPEDKSFEISKSTSHELWWNEVLKCIPLCALCHRKLHMDKLCLLPIRL
jgi:hypothetical protein